MLFKKQILILLLALLAPAAYSDESSSQVRDMEFRDKVNETTISLTIAKGTNTSLLKRQTSKKISTYNIDFSNDQLVAMGSNSEYQLLIKKDGKSFGLTHAYSKATAKVSTKLLGSSSALFDNASLSSKSTIETQSLGAFSQLLNEKNGKKSSQFSIRSKLSSGELRNTTYLRAGLVSSESEITEKLKNYEFGYSQNIQFDIFDAGAVGLNISRDKSFFGKHFSTDSFGIQAGYSMPLQNPSPKIRKPLPSGGKKIVRFTLLDGIATSSGSLSYNPDQYNGNSNYSAVIPITPRGLSISTSMVSGSFRQHYGFTHKKSRTNLSTVTLFNAFGSNNSYGTNYTATITRNLLTYAYEWDFNSQTYLLGGVSVGLMEVATSDQTTSKNMTKKKENKFKSPIGSITLGLGTKFPIDENKKYVIETRLDYLDAQPFSVPHQIIEITTLMGFEISF